MKNTTFDEFYKSSGICTDTRAITTNCLFVCIQGENFDGNEFSNQALESGASHVIVDNPKFYNAELAMTLVEDSVTYLQQLANHHRNKFDIPIIGITGSNGKTTTKELIHAVLSKKFNVLSTKGNLNNHLGVPLTLLRMTNEYDIAIIEMGANKFKDIEELCAVAQPNFGVITNIGKAHLEGFINFDGVLRTKRELYESVEKNKGILIVNGDDDTLVSALPLRVNTFSYGSTKKMDVTGKLIELTPYVNMTWGTADYSSPTLKTKMIGKYNYYNYLCAVAFGHKFGVENDDINSALTSYESENNRSQVKHTKRNTLILDCYNANPTSMTSALESFAANNSNREKLVVLGEMKELGTDSEKEHQNVVDLTEEFNLQGYFVGEGFSGMSSKSVLHHFASVKDMIENLDLSKIDDNLILLKGSRSVKLEDLENEL